MINSGISINKNGDESSQNKILIDSIVTPKKVLIVDDEPDIVEEVVERLDDEGLECVYAFNAAEAIEMVGSDPSIGVIVTDIRMPGMNGLEMARKLKDEAGSARDLYIIVVTGHAGISEAIEALQLGAEDFLTKPISPNHLLHSVRRAEEMIQLRANDRLFQLHLEVQVREKTTEVREMAEELAKRNVLLEEQNQELSAVSRLKDEFLQMMSHELNTPLNAIVGFAQLLKMNNDDTDDDTISMCADHILTAGNRLAAIVSSILTMSDISAGTLVLAPTSFSAQNLFDSAASELAHALEAGNMKLLTDLPDLPIELYADFGELMKAVTQVVENATIYGNEGGDITLSIRHENDHISITVSDQGTGMSDEQIAAAMEPLRQVDGSLSRRYEGMGLGLPLAKGIVELHGGSMKIKSELSKGTTVTLTLPDSVEEK